MTGEQFSCLLSNVGGWGDDISRYFFMLLKTCPTCQSHEVMDNYYKQHSS